MAKVYIPKTDHLSPERLKKACSDMLKQAKEDRLYAKEAYLFFKNIVDNSGEADVTDLDARKCMLDCLKLMQSAQTTAIRGLDTFIKAEDKFSNNKTQSTIKEEQPPSWKDLTEL